MITFIIPSINNTLQRSVDSLINQTDDDWKCIIVYDGVKGKKFQDSRIKPLFIEKTGIEGKNNGEAGLVRNVGIMKCDTEWIGFLDDDDTLDKDYVKTLKDKYLDYDVVIWRMLYKDGRVIPRFGNNKLVFGNVGISYCYKNKGLLFDENRTGEDLDFLKKILTDNHIITSEILYRVNH